MLRSGVVNSEVGLVNSAGGGSVCVTVEVGIVLSG